MENMTHGRLICGFLHNLELLKMMLKNAEFVDTPGINLGRKSTDG